VPLPPLHLAADSPALREGLARIRAELDVPGDFPAAVHEEAEARAAQVLGDLGADGRVDARDLPLVTIDPPASRDLDQALAIEPRDAGGWRVHYAIADVPAFVRPGGAIDAEAQRRGVTVYLPDERAPLHPPSLSEGAASLLPGEDRPALLWRIDLDAEGEVRRSDLRRAVVRSRAQLTYREVQAAVDGGTDDPTLRGLAAVGERRLALEAARGGVSLDLPAQEVVQQPDGSWTLEHEQVVPAMGWNAQISLLTGIVAATAMLEAGVGLLRTLPPPERDVIDRVARAAAALGLPWPEGTTYQGFVRGLDGGDPAERAVLLVAARGLRGSGYLALHPGRPAPTDPAARSHAAVAAPYAHVTAPLRRLCDRSALEVCRALYAGEDVPQETLDALEALPATMARTRGREGAAARAAVDLVEALLLESQVGALVEGTVIASSEQRSTVVLGGLAAEVPVLGVALPLAETVALRVIGVDVPSRTVDLAPA